jgi:hypothetical protein
VVRSKAAPILQNLSLLTSHLVADVVYNYVRGESTFQSHQNLRTIDYLGKTWDNKGSTTLYHVEDYPTASSPEPAEIKEYKETFTDKLSTSKSFGGQFLYRILDDAYLTSQLFRKSPRDIVHLGWGGRATVKEKTLAFATTASAFIPTAESEEALLELGSAAKEGEMTVYRVFGGDDRAEGFSWTTTNPNSVSNFRNIAELPSGVRVRQQTQPN